MDNSDSELFYLKWNNFQDNLASGFADLLQQEAMVDVTLAVEGRIVQAHKIILSICSQYFRKMFQLNPCKHPIIILKDVGYEELTDMLDFMYRGEARVKEEDLPSFLKLAETLKIRGLATGQTESNTISKKRLSSTASKQDGAESTLENTENKEVVIRKKRKRSGCVLKPLESKSGSHNEKVTVVETSEVPEKKQCTLVSEEELKSEVLSDDSFDDENLSRTAKFDTTTEDDLSAGPSGFEEASDAIPQDEAQDIVIPEKSKKTYESTYNAFLKWQKEKNAIDNFTETIMLEYFREMSNTYAPSSLWAKYSMLRSEIKIKHDTDIKACISLQKFLKNKSKGFKQKKSKTFSEEEIERFLREAPNEKYLLTKVATIFGVRGACRNQDLSDMLLEHVKDLGSMYHVTVPTPTQNSKEKSFIVFEDHAKIVEEYLNFRKEIKSSGRFLLQFRNNKCTQQPVGKLYISKMPSSIAAFLGLEEPEKYTGLSFRRASVSCLANAGTRLGASKFSSVTEGFIDQSLNEKRTTESMITSQMNKNDSTVEKQKGDSDYEQSTEDEEEEEN